MRSRWSEGRGPRGNTNKDRMHRTLSRVSMSSGLERVRERAKGREERSSRYRCIRTRRASSKFGSLRGGQPRERGLGKPETFNFLGVHAYLWSVPVVAPSCFIAGRAGIGCGSSSRPLKGNCVGGCTGSIPEQGRWLAQVVRGYFAYHAVPTNARRLAAFRYQLCTATM